MIQKRFSNTGLFNVEDTLVNAIFALNLDILAGLNAKIGNISRRKGNSGGGPASEQCFNKKVLGSRKKALFQP